MRYTDDTAADEDAAFKSPGQGAFAMYKVGAANSTSLSLGDGGQGNG